MSFSKTSLKESTSTIPRNRKSTIKTKSFMESTLSISTVAEDSWHTSAREVREDRRAQLTKVHRFLFSIVSHYLGFPDDEVEEFIVDVQQYIRVLEDFSRGRGSDVVLFMYTLLPPISFAECGRSLTNVVKEKDKPVMRVSVLNLETHDNEISGKCVYFLKKTASDLEDKTITEAFTCGSLNIKENMTVLGVLSRTVDMVHIKAMKRLKIFKDTKRKPLPDSKCVHNEMFVRTEDFCRHLVWGESHVLETIGLGQLENHSKMCVIDSVNTVNDCMTGAMNKSTVLIFEEIAKLWCDQVEIMLLQASSIQREADDNGPIKELEFWLQRSAQFGYLVQQIRSQRARMVFHLLYISKSPIMARWRELDMKVTDQSNEARDNAKYLYILEKYCEPLYRCQPQNLIENISGLIGAIRLIYNYSHYYTSPDTVSRIFVKITNQIVTACKNYISDDGFTKLWDLPKQDLQNRIKDCLKLFQTYIDTYKATKKKIAIEKNERPFDFSEMYIFGKIFVFQARLEQILNLFDNVTTFSVLEVSRIEGLDTYANKYNTLFNNLKKKGHDLLNHKNPAFEEDFERFLDNVEDLKTQIAKFMVNHIRNIKGSLNKLIITRNFELLKLSFLDTECEYSNILTFYGEELDAIMQMYDREKDDPQVQRNMPPIAGRISFLRQILSHIAEPIFLLQKYSPCVLKTKPGKKITYRYNKFVILLVKTEVMLHIMWFRSVPEIDYNLQVPLLIKNQSIKEYVINFDFAILEVLKEAFYMVKLGLHVPRNVIRLIFVRNKISSIYFMLMELLAELKEIKSMIPDLFLPLMMPSIYKIDSLILVGETSLTWTSLEVSDYFITVEKAFADLKNAIKLITDMKALRIDKKLAQMSEMNALPLPTTTTWSVEEFLNNTKEVTKEVGNELSALNRVLAENVYELINLFIGHVAHEYNDLETIYAAEQKIVENDNKKPLRMDQLQQALETINPNIEKMIPPVDDILNREMYKNGCLNMFEDFKIKMTDALIKCVKLSLMSLRKRFLCGVPRALGASIEDEMRGPSRPFLKLFVQLENKTVITSPKLELVSSAFNKVAQMVQDIGKRIFIWSDPPASLFAKLELKSQIKVSEPMILLQKNCYKLLMENKDVVKYNNMGLMFTPFIEEIKKALKIFKNFEHIWMEDKEEKLQEFLKTNPGLYEFKEEYIRLQKLSKRVDNIVPEIAIGNICLDTETIKLTLQEEIVEWMYAYGIKFNAIIRQNMEEIAQFISEKHKLLNKPVKDLDDIRLAMSALQAIRENYIHLDEQITPIEECYALMSSFGFVVKQEEIEKAESLRYAYEKLMISCTQVTDHLVEIQGDCKAELTTDVEVLHAEIAHFVSDYYKKGPMEPGIPPAVANERLQNFQAQFDYLIRKHTANLEGEELFGLPRTEEHEFTLVRKELTLLQKLYGLYTSVMTSIDGYNEMNWLDINCEKINAELTELQNRCRRLPKGLKDWQAYNDLKKKIDDFNETVPLLELMANKSMATRHWMKIEQAANYKFDFDLSFDQPMDLVMENVRLKDIMKAPLLPVKDDVEDICISAVKEKDIEAKLKMVMNDWSNRTLTFANFKNRGELLLKSSEALETISMLEDSLMVLSSLITNRYNAPYKNKIQAWVHFLSTTADVLEQWITVQNTWVYLEAVFVGGDIAKQLPQESKRFSAIDKSWLKIMQRAHENDNVISCCAGDDMMIQILPHLFEQLELCQKSLTGYLEKKRLLFPRFFFVSDPALLEILGQASDCHTIQAHLLGLFDNIKSVEFHEKVYDLIITCISREGEKIALDKPVKCEHNVEIWLDILMNEQQSSLHIIIRDAYRSITSPDYDLYTFLSHFPAQVGLLGIQFLWTKTAEEALKGAKFDRKFMINANNFFMLLLNMLIAKTTENLTAMDRVKYETLITIHVHQRDIFDDLTKRNVNSPVNFDWLKQARFYYNEEVDLAIIRITDVMFTYQNEYLGCTDRLVITPLTDRCYITLAQALWMSLGGAPAGPAGTGKTETTKDMGRCLGKYVVVFNCSDQMDFRGLGRIYKGLAQSGAWGCFDEFNRIELPVLSVAAQQIYIVLNAKKDKKKEFIFTDGDRVLLNPEFGIFLTMNPGYAGRQELPENLKIMFRTVSMMVPDRQIIMRVKLASCGFIENIILAQKFYTLYKLCEEQLSKQVHYDFGLRNILSVLRTLGAEKRSRPEDTETTIVMRVLRDMNLSKLVDEDEPLFLSLISDLFPGISLDSASYLDLQSVLATQINEAQLINYESWNLKIVQLFETQRVRHGIMTLGPTGTGKTCCIRMLMKAMTELGNPHREMRMNPKAITAPQMFGRLDAATNDWTDGIFSTLWRRTLKIKKGSHVWLILDGPVDAVWIENLNSVLDDNKTLTLANGDRIPMSPTCKLIFEVHNIDNASPATVSRNGMIFMSSSVLPWLPILQGWLLKRSVHERMLLVPLFESLYDDTEHFTILHTEAKMEVHSCIKIKQMCDLLQGLIPASIEDKNKHFHPKHMDHLFIFCLMWSLGALLELDDRVKMQEFLLRHKSKLNYPKICGEETIFEYMVGPEGQWLHWRTKVEQYIYPSDSVPLFSTILVPNVDNVRTDYLIEVIGKQSLGVLLIGEQGTAKTVMIQASMAKANPEERLSKSFNFSSATTPGMFQRTIESYVEKRVGTTYGPPGGKSMTVFIDDINMPIINEWGDQVTNEITRQMMEMKGMYSLDKPGDFLDIVDISFKAAMIHPGGGRNDIPERLKRQFCIFNCTLPSNHSIDKIFGIIGQGYFCESRFLEPVVEIVKYLVPCTRILWQRTKIKMLPTPAKFHYIFNLRDLSRIWQGMLYIEGNECSTVRTVINLWKHEVCRVIEDRFINDEDKSWFQNALYSVISEVIGTEVADMMMPFPHFVDFMRDIVEELILEDTGSLQTGQSQMMPKVYEMVEEYDILRSRLQAFMKDYNEQIRGSHMNLVFFKDAMIHLTKVSRIIRTNRGAALLVGVGGSGKQSLTRLASFIAGYQSFQIMISKTYTMTNLMEDFKFTYKVSGFQGLGITFIFTDNEIKEEYYLEYINNILNSGEISNLFPKDELLEICNDLAPIMKKEFPRRPPTIENLYDYFLARARSNLHIVLCFSPVGNKFRMRSLKFPGLISGCTMDWYSKWPREALIDVSFYFLEHFEMEATDEAKNNLIELMGTVHDQVSNLCFDYFQRFRRQANVTPKSYLSFLDGYKNLYQIKVDSLKELERKMLIGLEKLAEAADSVDQLSQDLVVKEKELEIANVAADKIVLEVSIMAEAAEKVKASVQKVKDRAQKIVNDIAVEKALAESKLEEAKPALQAAEDALKTIKPADIATVKKLGKPPHLIMRIMDCCLILFRKKLDIFELDSERPCPKPSWGEGLKLMGNMGFLLSLVEFNKDTITGEIVELMEPYFKMDDYTYDSALKACGNVAGLLSWTLAMAAFYAINKEVLPLKVNLVLQEGRLNVAIAELQVAQAALDEKQAELNVVQAKYDAAMGKKKNLMEDAEATRRRMEAATALIGGLGGEQARWSSQSQEFRNQIICLTGDVLICTGFLSYAGPFNQMFRNKLITTWCAELNARKIPFTKTINIVDSLVDTTTIAEWNVEGLPSDDLSVQNGIITTMATRYPLLIDPQHQGKTWIKHREKKRHLQVTSLSHKYFRQHLEDALSLGRPLLIEDVQEDLDPSLDNILDKNFIKSGSMLKVKVGDKECDITSTFYLYITTKLANPVYSPEVSARTSIIDFTVTQKGLEDQLLGRVLVTEKRELEEERSKLAIDVVANKRKIKELEENLLFILTSIQGSLVDDPTLIEVLRNTKKTSAEVTEKLAIAAETSLEIHTAREEFRPVAARGSILYFLLCDMAMVNHMYSTSLIQFLVLFDESMARSKPNFNTQKRISNIIEYLTFAVWVYTTRSLYNQDRQLFTLLLAVKIDLARGLIKNTEFQAFIKGGAALDMNAVTPKPARWISDVTWLNLVKLSELSIFRNILTQVASNEKAWKHWYDKPAPEEDVIPENYGNMLDPFNKLLLIRSWCPDRTSVQARDYISNSLGTRYTEAVILDIEAMYEESKPRTPLIALLSMGSDPTNEIESLSKRVEISFQAVSMGQGQEVHARKLIGKYMEEERRKFGPLGWNIPYEFNSSDWSASVQFIQNHLDDMDLKRGISWPTVRYMIGEVQYGGRVTDDFDKRLLNTFTKVWFGDFMFHDSFQFFKNYKISRNHLLTEVMDFIEALPAVDSPEALGLHPNADITYQTNTAKQVLDTIIQIQPKDASSGCGETRESVVYRLAEELLYKLPHDYIPWDVKDRLKKMGNLQPLNIFLRQEIDRMQRVISLVRATLTDLKLAIEGTIIMSENLRDALDNLFDARVPARWIRFSWQSSTIGFWYTDLLERNTQFANWIFQGRPVVFWMTGFFNPQGFLTAMRQEVTRAHKGWALDSVSLHNDITKFFKDDINIAPPEGVYIYGLFLDGAQWDRRNSRLAESQPKVLFVALPVVHMYAINSTSPKDPKLYQCPVYKKPCRTDLTYVTTIYMRTTQSPDLWILRGVAALCDIK
ncbi:dynein axonemal heavy chain 8-like isoform X3 [Biomphalaria glabrata]|uniref:Dynein axonemal heavy chain 8-like isoform X3 n=1 Tax=Biomphalaria glabrata TaxID=6526 RepID=A0A9W2YHU4_BIOGL|nr:dynein axonemal heavy chain 8-like isoform X3 [Biomphalaria glabrata]